MNKIRVFIDGSAGTTGLRIADRLKQREEIELLSISEEGRKEEAERARVIRSADLAFLCLPDAAAKSIVPLVGSKVRLLDTSTAHSPPPSSASGASAARSRHSAGQMVERQSYSKK